MHTTLTDRQRQVLEFIYKQIKTSQIPPSIREISAHFGFSSLRSSQDHLKALVDKGYLKISQKKSRAIEIINKNLFAIPIVGRVQAGMPTLAVENIEGYLNLDELIFANSGIFGLRVKGDSMANAGIIHGDLVLVRQQASAEIGNIIVAMIEDEATIKYLRKKEGHYFLEPANPNYGPIPLGETSSIIGQVLTVIRNV